MTNFTKALITTITCLLFIWFQQAAASTNVTEDETVSISTEGTESNPTVDNLLAQIQTLSKEDFRALRKAIKSSMGLKKKKDKNRNKNCKKKSKQHDSHKYSSEKKHMNGSYCMWKNNSNFKSKKKYKAKKYKKQCNRSSSTSHGQKMRHGTFMKNYYEMRGRNQHQHRGGYWPNYNSFGWGGYYH